jgi:hypothetical protein
LTELDVIGNYSRDHPNKPPVQLYPYHYLALLSINPEKKPIPPVSDLPTKLPYFVHPDRSLSHTPLTVWVSINIHKNEDETPLSARDNVMHQLLLGGGIAVEKRAHADILIVDRTTRFYQDVILGEMKKYGRGWKLAEREWVERCVKMEGISPGWGGTIRFDKDTGEESFGEDEGGAGKGKGPGRPTGM